MVFIAGGTFTMGLSEAGIRDMRPFLSLAYPHQVTLTKPYCIDVVEVSARKHLECIAAGGCPATRAKCNRGYEKYLDHPSNCVNWTDAVAYCEWAGKRLPTEAEWEFAARGPKGFRHPWGDTKPDDSKLWYSGTKIRMGTSVVGTHPAGASPFGMLDMEGNVSEYVSDWEAHHPRTPQINPTGPASGTQKVTKGGAMDSGGAWESDLGERTSQRPDDGHTDYDRGFRCAR
jgi:formylglycine-generating enzyme required for sulfatase activity